MLLIVLSFIVILLMARWLQLEITYRNLKTQHDDVRAWLHEELEQNPIRMAEAVQKLERKFNRRLIEAENKVEQAYKLGQHVIVELVEDGFHDFDPRDATCYNGSEQPVQILGYKEARRWFEKL